MTIFAGPATISVAEITIITILAGNISAVISHALTGRLGLRMALTKGVSRSCPERPLRSC